VGEARCAGPELVPHLLAELDDEAQHRPTKPATLLTLRDGHASQAQDRERIVASSDHSGDRLRRATPPPASRRPRCALAPWQCRSRRHDGGTDSARRSGGRLNAQEFIPLRDEVERRRYHQSRAPAALHGHHGYVGLARARGQHHDASPPRLPPSIQRLLLKWTRLTMNE